MATASLVRYPITCAKQSRIHMTVPSFLRIHSDMRAKHFRMHANKFPLLGESILFHAHWGSQAEVPSIELLLHSMSAGEMET